MTALVVAPAKSRILGVDLCFHLPRTLERFLPPKYHGYKFVDQPAPRRLNRNPVLFETAMADGSALLKDLEASRLFPQFHNVGARNGELYFKVGCCQAERPHSQEARELLYRFAWEVRVYEYEPEFDVRKLVYSLRTPQMFKTSEARYALRLVGGVESFPDRSAK